MKTILLIYPFTSLINLSPLFNGFILLRALFILMSLYSFDSLAKRVIFKGEDLFDHAFCIDITDIPKKVDLEMINSKTLEKPHFKLSTNSNSLAYWYFETSEKKDNINFPKVLAKNHFPVVLLRDNKPHYQYDQSEYRECSRWLKCDFGFTFKKPTPFDMLVFNVLDNSKDSSSLQIYMSPRPLTIDQLNNEIELGISYYFKNKFHRNTVYLKLQPVVDIEKDTTRVVSFHTEKPLPKGIALYINSGFFPPKYDQITKSMGIYNYTKDDFWVVRELEENVPSLEPFERIGKIANISSQNKCFESNIMNSIKISEKSKLRLSYLNELKRQMKDSPSGKYSAWNGLNIEDATFFIDSIFERIIPGNGLAESDCKLNLDHYLYTRSKSYYSKDLPSEIVIPKPEEMLLRVFIDNKEYVIKTYRKYFINQYWRDTSKWRGVLRYFESLFGRWKSSEDFMLKDSSLDLSNIKVDSVSNINDKNLLCLPSKEFLKINQRD